jgi:N-acetylglucosaminyl-diphospho-decaprenol L-rhamnosyltransferase
MITVVIVNWNSGCLLESCIKSLLANAGACEIIIVDNGSSDSSLDFIPRTGSEIKVIRNDRNLGFSAGNNLGWKAGEGTEVLFLNPDTECLPQSVQLLEQTIHGNSEVWAVGGQLISPSGEPQHGFNVRSFPTLAGVACQMFFCDRILQADRRAPSVNAEMSTLPLDVDQPAAACLMVTRTALEEIGGFDEKFQPAWFEDVDLCRRIRSRGGRIQYQPAARFLHHRSYSLAHMSRESFLEMFHTNQIRYFRKHHGNRSASRVRAVIVCGLLLRSMLSLIYPMAPNASHADSARIFWNVAQKIRKLAEEQS